MAHRTAGVEKRPATPGSIKEDDGTAAKQLKQGRLPFKPLGCKPLTPLNNTSSRKRKLSGQDSPNKSKVPKLPEVKNSVEKIKPAPVNDDNEVSSTSSSEAEHQATNGSKSKTGKANLLEKFVRRENEISSTNDVIDLTESGDENDPKQNSPVKPKSPQKSVISSPRPKLEPLAKDKPEANFSRKLVFDKEEIVKPETKVLEECAPAKTEKEAVKHETENVLEESAAPKQERETVEEESKTVKEECDAENVQKEIKPEDAAAMDVSIVSDDEEANVDEDKVADAVTPLKDESSDSSVCETSLDHSSVSSQKEEGSPSGSETPASKGSLPLTSTPQTPAEANTSCTSADGATPLTDPKKRVLSKRQQGKASLRQKVMGEKERQKQEAKEQREKERLEKKQKRDEEKAEKERIRKEEKDKKEKERLEKKDQVEKEKQSRLQQKEEEKQKRQEKLNAKLEEKKLKEEERRQKEEQKQKEEEEKLRQAEKRKAAFTSFFTNSKSITSTKVTKTENKLFIPFELKKDMTLAPTIRQTLSGEDKQHLDNILSCEESAKLRYLEELGQGIKKPLRVNRVLRKKKEIEQEVELLVHDSETVKKVTHAVKLLQFHTDYRPPYYGTWRKKVAGLSPRNPWKKDQEVFDYEVDSDEEWEEEEPGESLSDSNGEEEEGEEEDEVDDDGWMVPHGYLSEDEGCQDDEDVTPEVLKARQRAKAQAWETELQAKRQMMPPLHLGCVWLDMPCLHQRHVDILSQFQMVCLRSSPIETLVSCPAHGDGSGDKSTDASAKSSPTSKGFRKQALPEEAMPDLIRLVHGNTFGIKKLVREFRLYWKQKSSDVNLSLDESRAEEEEGKPLDDSAMDTSVNLTDAASKTPEPAQTTEQTEQELMQVDSEAKPAEQGVSEKKHDDSVGTVEEAGQNCVSKRQLEIKILSIAAREKRAGRRQCWYVSDVVLKQHGMEDQPLDNAWVYVSGDMKKPEKKTPNPPTEKKTPNPPTEKKTPNPPTDKKTPKSAKEKKTPTRLTENKISKFVVEVNNAADVVSGVEASCTRGKGKDGVSADSTPKRGKNRKEGSAKKTPKDQTSIMAFAKKPLAGSSGTKAESKRGSDLNAAKNNANGEENAESNKNAGVAEPVSAEKPADSQQSVQAMDEDCIVLD